MASVALFEERKGCPMDDVMTVWTKAEIEGRALTPEEVASDCLLILDGGAETTRTVIGRTLLNLFANRDQWQLLKSGKADFTVATDEFIRYVTPVLNMCRVATVDYDLHGTTIPQGHQVSTVGGTDTAVQITGEATAGSVVKRIHAATADKITKS